MILSTFSPLAESDQQQRKHRGEEAGYLQSGRPELTLDGDVFVLEQGDSFFIKAKEVHQVRNPSDKEDAVILWVITPPCY